MRRFLPLLFALVVLPTWAQNDSLWSVWNNAALPDSARLKAMQVLAWKAVFEQPDSGMALAHRQLELAVKANDAKARFEAYTTSAMLPIDLAVIGIVEAVDVQEGLSLVL